MKNSPLIIGIIPARGGSKRIPGKNIKEFCGKPLIAWTIEEAKKSKYISRIIVTTDDPEIRDIAKQYGAEVPFMRPAEIAGDLTPDLPVFEHVVKWLRENGEDVPDVVAHLRVTGPLRTVEDIDRGIELLLENRDYDSVRAVISTPLHPLKTYRLDGKNLSSYIPEEVHKMDEPFNQPVQALPKAYAAVGYFSAILVNTILEKKSMTGRKILGYEVNAHNATDIDTPLDWEVARLKMEKRIKDIK